MSFSEELYRNYRRHREDGSDVTTSVALTISDIAPKSVPFACPPIDLSGGIVYLLGLPEHIVHYIRKGIRHLGSYKQ